jgi:lysophospholipase L1-like esterase
LNARWQRDVLDLSPDWLSIMIGINDVWRQLVDTQLAFDHAMRHMHPAGLSGDRIHPNLPGHMIIARSFLNAIGYQLD